MVSPAARGQWLGGSEGETYEIKTEPDRFRHTYFRSPREWVSGGRGFALGAVGKQKTPAGVPLNSFSCRAAMLTAFKSMAGPSPSELLHDPSGFFRIPIGAIPLRVLIGQVPFTQKPNWEGWKMLEIETSRKSQLKLIW